MKKIWFTSDLHLLQKEIVMSHYAMRVWNQSHRDSWMLYGHSHGMLPPVGKQYDVGVDSNNFMPVSYDQISTIMNHSEHNPNYLKMEERA